MTGFYGFRESDFGLGEATRRLRSLLIASGFSLTEISLHKAENQDNSDAMAFFSVNPDQLVRYASRITDSAKAIGFWAWELEDVPSYFKRTASLLNMILTISTFSASALTRSGIHSRCARIPVPIPRGPRQDSNDFGYRQRRFNVLVSFDFSSDPERKNPKAAIDAYKRAFPSEMTAKLTIKSIGGSKQQVSKLRAQIGNRRDITLLTHSMPRAEFDNLLAHADVFLSLHRSEGYGLNLADAMARRVPVIATGYSGNLDFMDEDASILVPFELVPVNFYAGLPIRSVWAEPDIEFAAVKLRTLYEDEKLRREIGEAGYKKILTEHSLPVAVKKFQEEFMNG